MTATTGSAEVLACPFCQTRSIGTEHDLSIFAGQTYPSHSNSDGWKLRCDGCGNQTAWWHSEADARKAWNTRLAAKSAEEVREATIEECAKVAASFKYSEETKKVTNGTRTYGNDEACDKIALAIRALSTPGQPKP